ncbi:uncharacterized protein UV8b_03172 [Ustilaginoidea virens]|uniref:Eisosome protein 1 protein n=1 Tax=Ustilaginoidea virens TaxID=1159556 RepID=A0A8E5MGJ6_USTVR|nr:uncharacterized protein UV8b_03172 [Ustilaginoidea virens]QUC18931.1 hypothetical protein UV8b_03172 [Ustilaginoidea virens]
MAATKTPAQQAPPPQAPPSIQNNTGRIKYADPRSLPSFPSSGLAPDGAAASAAASLGWSNQKPVNLWKPDPSSSASAAAVLAKNYKMSPLWEPSAQSDGQKAALLAVGSAGAALKSSTAHSGPSQGTWGNSAAVKAFHANRPSDGGSAGGRAQRNASAAQASDANQPRSPKKDERAKIPPGSKSLAAAKGAMNRPVSVTGLKDVQASEASAAASALNGATLAHRQSIKQQTKPNLEDVGAVSVTTMTRNMFTANPPVKPEVDERTYNEKIHQSAVEMAKKMYARQQITAEQTKCSQSGNLDKAQPNQYLNLQDAAYKQAQARLAKLHDEYQQGREMQEYYGKEQTSPKRRSSIINKLRRRGSDSDGSLDDRQQSERIREQMSMFSSKLSQVDKEKRDKDREALMAAAQRNVKARLHGMDEKVYQDTGRATSSSLMTDWEAKAHKAAQTLHVSHADKNKDKVDIGGGMFMTQEEINAIASKRIQPVLDDIKGKAETERERQEVLKLEEQARREEAEKQKLRDREAKEIVKKSKEQDKQEEKAKKLQGKLEEKQRKDDERAKKEGEKAAKAEQKRLSKELAKEDKRKSKLGPVLAVTVATSSLQEHQADNEGELHSNAHGDDQPRPTENVHFVGGERPTVETNIESAASAHQQGEVQSSPTAKVKGWIKTRFSRGKSFGEHDQKRRSFFGGASMKDHATAATGNGSVGSIENRSSSMHDVALAGKADEQNDKAEVNVKDEHGESAQHFAATDSRGVSPVSTSQDDERELGEELQDEDLPQKKEEDRQSRKASMAPPRPIEDPVARTSSSPTRDSRFREEMDQ